jgi:hypothetical protein
MKEALFVLIIILYIFFTWNVKANEDYLYGYWMADDDEFCDISDITSMSLFIGEPTVSWSGAVERNCYLVITDDICNQGLTIKYRSGWAGPTLSKYNINAKVEFEIDDIWPDNINISIDIRNGTMVIRSGDMVYARLTKQHDITNTCRAMESKNS